MKNSCRSQIAAGYANSLGKDWFEAKPVGLEANGINPRAISIMQEEGVDISTQASANVTEEMINWADLIVTVCQQANNNCPVPPIAVRKKHWPLADPVNVEGTEEQIMQEYRAVRDEIKRRVESMLGGMKMLSN